MTMADFPRYIMIEPTNVCNSRCPLCPTGAGVLRRPKGFMSLTLYKRLIDEIQGHQSTITLWHYGEPFMHREIYAFIQYAAKRDIPVISSTNGFAFYEKSSINALIHSGLSRLIVSIDGATHNNNSKYRDGVDFDRVITGLRHYKELAMSMNFKDTPKITIQMIAFKHNISDIDAIRLLAEQMDADFEIKTANLNMVEGIQFETYLPDQEEYRRYEWNSEISGWQHKGEFENKCSFVETGLAINWDGTISPCCYDYQAEYSLGNVNENSISTIWSSDTFEILRNAIQQNRAGLPVCSICGVDRPQRRLNNKAN